MHCPACKATVPNGTTKCPKCGKPALASTSDEIDLMPMDEPKPSDAPAFNPHPEPTAPPRSPAGKGVKRVGPAVPGEEPPAVDEPIRVRAGALVAKGSNVNLIAGGVVGLLLVLFIGWRMLRTENKIVLGDGNVDNKPFTIQPNQVLMKNLDISGMIHWNFEVMPESDSVLVGVVQRGAKDPATIAALKKLPESLEIVKKGDVHPMSGEFKTGSYSWVVINENKKAVRVKVKFKAQP
jgi:hypothetical protein